jgi:hypothetical protein
VRKESGVKNRRFLEKNGRDGGKTSGDVGGSKKREGLGELW